MNEINILFETVGDINSTYPYLCIYDKKDQINPFMEIAITNDKQLQYIIYAGTRDITLTTENWDYIWKKAQEFFVWTLANVET